MDLLGVLLSSFSQTSTMTELAGKTGLTPAQMSKLIKIAIPIITAAMAKNASSKEGAKALNAAADSHKTAKSTAEQVKDADEVDGAKILGHIFGSKKDDSINDIAKESGLDAGDVAKVMAIIAPSVLSGLSNATSEASSKKEEEASGGVGAELLGSLLSSMLK